MKIALTLPGGQTVLNPQNKFNDLGSFLSGLFNVVFYIAGFLVLFWLVWGIFQYIFAGGNKDALGKAQARITWAIVGFLILTISFAFSQYAQGLFEPKLPNLTNLTIPPSP